ncbi:MAG: methionyl-tRNA formyltransferase [Spirochaetales bacterium]|nr:methionyl-tRNA formyltransferase [Spirochaetales bacterium]
MKIIFAGTPEFSVPSFKAICEKFDVIAVLTAPDKLAGRGKKIQPSPVKIAAMHLGIRVFQPEKLNQEFRDELAPLKPDLLAVAAYSKIFRREFIDLFTLGGINLHPSLLPQWRGPAPIPAAILSGQKESGITIQTLDLQMDAGDIILQKTFPLYGKETTTELSSFCSQEGAKMMAQAILLLEQGKREFRKQDEDKITYCHLINKQDGLINWSLAASKIERMIRAYSPWPRAYTFWKEKSLALTKANVIKSDYYKNAAPGKVIDLDQKEGILIATGEGILAVQMLQLQTKKEMDFKAFLNGNKDFLGSTLGE